MAELQDGDDDVVDDIEMKRIELNEGGRIHTKITANSQGYNPISSGNGQQVQYIYTQPPSSTSKTYCKAIYLVLIHIVIVYCALGVTYVLFIGSNKSNCTCTSTETLPAENIDVTSIQPTANPSISPSRANDIITTNHPTESIVTDLSTTKPTSQPIFDYSDYQHLIGDFKISAHNSSHDNWLLCDGSFIDPNKYPQLFDVIGYSFGSEISGTVTLFGLPDAVDRVVGITGDSNLIGTMRGNEQISLTEDDLPSHWHYLVYGDNGNECTGQPSSSSYPYLAQECTEPSGLLNDADDEYKLRATTNQPNRLQTGNVGNGTAINIMQPTVFVGNLFIYAG